MMEIINENSLKEIDISYADKEHVIGSMYYMGIGTMEKVNLHKTVDMLKYIGITVDMAVLKNFVPWGRICIMAMEDGQYRIENIGNDESICEFAGSVYYQTGSVQRGACKYAIVVDIERVYNTLKPYFDVNRIEEVSMSVPVDSDHNLPMIMNFDNDTVLVAPIA